MKLRKSSLFHFLVTISLLVESGCSESASDNSSPSSTPPSPVVVPSPVAPVHDQPTHEAVLQSLGCPGTLAAAVGMKPTGRVMACAKLRTPEPAWALWHWEVVEPRNTRPKTGREFALTRTILDSNTLQVRWNLGQQSIGYEKDYSRASFVEQGPNRLEIADFDGDGSDEILERFGGTQHGKYSQDAVVIRLAPNNKMQFITVPRTEYFVVDSDDNSDPSNSPKVCRATLKIIRTNPNPILEYRSYIFSPDHPKASSCRKVEGIVMTMLEGRFSEALPPPPVPCGIGNDCPEGKTCQIVPSCPVCDGGSTFCL